MQWRAGEIGFEAELPHVEPSNLILLKIGGGCRVRDLRRRSNLRGGDGSTALGSLQKLDQVIVLRVQLSRATNS